MGKIATFACLLMIAAAGCDPKRVSTTAEPAEPFGLSDSKVSLQSIIDSAKDDQNVRIPAARYKCDQTVVIKDRKNLTLEFAPGARIIMQNPSADALVMKNCNNVCISNVLIKYSSKPAATSDTDAAAAKLVESDSGSAAKSPIAAVRLNNCEGITLIDCEISNSPETGLAVASSHKVTIRKSAIHDSSTVAISMQTCSRIKIADCVIENNGAEMQLYDVTELDSYNNQAIANGGYWEPANSSPGPKR